jgi:hypothetical protein
VTLKMLGTVLLSVILSLGVTLWVSRQQKHENADVLQARSIQLVDTQHRVRGTIGLVQVDGHEQPQIILRGEDGQPSVLLSLDAKGQGTLVFNSKDKEGKVGVGYLWGSDVRSRDEDDPLGSWGLRVLGRNGQATGLGIGNTGRILSQAASGPK